MSSQAIPISKSLADKPPRRRLWIPISLRIFVATLAIVFVASVWLAYPLYRRYLVAREVTKCGGDVTYRSQPNPGTPEILRFPPLTDADGVYFCNGCTVSRDVWNNLHYLGNLESLQFDGSDFCSDDALAMRALPTVEMASFFGSAMNDRAISCLLRLSNLETVYLDWTDVTDVSLATVAALMKLKELHLDNTKVTDAGLGSLEKLASLKILSLTNTRVSDAGLVHLRRLTTLQRLYLDGTQVTDAGVAELMRALPDLTIKK